MPPLVVKTNGRVAPHPLKWHQRLVASLSYALIRCVAATLRFQWRDRSGLFDGEPVQPAIFNCWHNRLAVSLVTYNAYVRRHQKSRRLAAMVSASKDGGIVARVLEHFGVEPVRGSTSRRGPQALLELTTWAERGFDLAITPDGPRGPCYVVQEGIMSLAQLTGLPIVPYSYHLNWKIRLKSWDRFQVPLPFARCEVEFGEPIRVARDASDAEREARRRELEARMRDITRD